MGVFFYGPGYPALAVPFAGIGLYGWPFEDPFLPANFAIFLLTVSATYLVGRRLLGEWAGVAAALALVFATPLVRFVTLPWNTTVCLGAVAVTLLVALRPVVGPLEAAFLGLAVGFAYSARYVDALWIAIIALAILVARVPSERESWRVLAGLVGGAAIPLLPTFYLHWRVFGNPFTQTYTFHHNVGRAQFDVSDIPSHGLQAFVSPYFFADEPTKTSPLLSIMFLVLLAPLGAWFLLRAPRGPRLIIAAGYALASAAADAVLPRVLLHGQRRALPRVVALPQDVVAAHGRSRRSRRRGHRAPSRRAASARHVGHGGAGVGRELEAGEAGERDGRWVAVSIGRYDRASMGTFHGCVSRCTRGSQAASRDAA